MLIISITGSEAFYANFFPGLMLYSSIRPESDGLEFLMEAAPQDAVCSPEVAARTAGFYERVKTVIAENEWSTLAPHVDAVIRLKKERNAVVLAHNYQTPDIFHCIADIVGDSLALARKAAEVEADVIVMCGVHFMAETAKLMNPEKTVIIPDPNAGCSLAESVTAKDVEELRKRYPGVPVVTYVNTTADVKAACDICCTSANAVQVVESLGVDRVIMVPDEYLALNTAQHTDVEIIAWKGRCEVHERFTAGDIRQVRKDHPGVVVLAHPECAPDVLVESDFAGSTAGMSDYVAKYEPETVMMVTECSMSANVAAAHPNVDFIRSCHFCPHMKLITMPDIQTALETMTHKVTLEPSVSERARQAVDRMLAVRVA